MEALNALECLLRAGGGDVIPREKCTSCAEYVGYSSRFLDRSAIRLYGRVPCVGPAMKGEETVPVQVIYIGVITVLKASWEQVEITFRPGEPGARIFLVLCEHAIQPPFDAEEASLRLARGPLVAQKEYNQMIADGCSLTNLQTFLQVCVCDLEGKQNTAVPH